MQIIGLLELLCWLTFIVVWFISSFSAKRNLKNVPWWLNPWLRIVIAILVYALFRNQIAHSFAMRGFHLSSLPISTVGLILTAAGIGFAIWARFYLGRNWGMPMTLKENRELVSTGPYKYVRHPIYTGMLLAVIGSVLVVGALWLIVFAFVFIYFLFSAITEEKMLAKELPDQYPAYKARTKMLIPFIL